MNLLQVPLHDLHVAAGAKMVPFAGFEMPVQYEGIQQEHRAVRTSVGLFDVSHMGEVEVRGPDALEATQRLITNDLSTLKDGQALYTVMCLPDGGIVDDLIVYRLGPEHILLCVNASNRDTDFEFIRSHIKGNVVLEDTSDGWIQLALQGPAAENFLNPLADVDLSQLDAFRCQFARVAGHRCLIARTGYTGEDGFELYIPVEVGSKVFDALMEHGQKSQDGPTLCGLGARDTLRLEARYLLYGNDIDRTTNPLEAGLGWVVKFDKGDFLGREALLQRKEEGVTRRLRGFRLESRGVLRAGYDLTVEGKKVGQLTSGGYAPYLESSIGLGYIDLAFADRTEAQVEIRGKSLPVSLHRKPFYTRNRT